jgi:lipopolysaccharide/colanic/teichoic acid biosynthesis glycosyltransferase
MGWQGCRENRTDNFRKTMNPIEQINHRKAQKRAVRLKKIVFYLFDLALLVISFFAAVYLKRHNFYLSEEYKILLLVFGISWLLSSALGRKIRWDKPRTLREGFQPFLRSFTYLLILFLFIHVIFRLFFYSRFIILASLVGFIILEGLAYALYYLIRYGPNVQLIEEEEAIADKKEDRAKLDKKDLRIDFEGRRVKEPLKEKLEATLLKDHKNIFEFINSVIHLDRINASDSLLLDTNSSQGVEAVLHSGMEFIGNLHMVNDIQRINRFFITVNHKLKEGGYSFCVAETLNQRLTRRLEKYPKFMRRCAYFIDFLWTRVFPKIPFLKKIYFMIHGQNRRIISETELLGRLYYCGFKVEKQMEIDNKLHLIVKKISEPVVDEDPSYGPVFKQRRIGQDHKIIYTYKFRTMHPFSEYLHEYMLENFELDETGKVKNDFRVTSWGRFMRRYWIDELPMLINLLQGDLKLVGLRPVSQSFFNIYPEELKVKRMEIRPGLVPSLYADRTKTKQDIFESEKKYLEWREKHPIRTDIYYFFKVMFNIFFRKARSA